MCISYIYHIFIIYISHIYHIYIIYIARYVSMLVLLCFSPYYWYWTFVDQLLQLVMYIVDEKRRMYRECISQERLRLLVYSLYLSLCDKVSCKIKTAIMMIKKGLLLGSSLTRQ